MYSLITDNNALAAYCQQVAADSVLALDTEFIRQSTLYPKLGLIQMYDGVQLALVDPLAISEGGAQTRTSAPSVVRQWIFDRATRLCRISPQTTILRPVKSSVPSPRSANA